MANWSDLTFTSGQLDYIAMLNTLRSRSQDVATEVENARGGAANLNAGIVKYSANTANIALSGYRINGAALTPITSSELTSKDYVDTVGAACNTYTDGQVSPKANKAGETYTGAHNFVGATITAATQITGSTGNAVATLDFVNNTALSTSLPGLAGNSLKVLRVNAGETAAEWALGLPLATSNEGKTLALDSAAAPKWITKTSEWNNWQLITPYAGTFTVPDGITAIRAYVFGKGGDGATTTGSGGGGGGGCTFGTIPCKPGDVFTFDTTTGAVLKKGATVYLSANNGSNGSGSTGGAGAAAGTVGAGLGITGSGAYGGGAGGDGNGTNNGGGGGGSSGSPIGAGNAGATNAGGGGWGCAGNTYGGGGVGAQVATGYTLSGAYAINGEAASRDWSNAFTDPLLRPCNFVSPASNYGRYASTTMGTMNAPPGSGGGTTGTGGSHGGAGGLGGGGGLGVVSGYNGGDGGFGGGGGTQAPSASSGRAGNGGVGGGGGGKASSGSSAGTGGSAAVVIFW